MRKKNNPFILIRVSSKEVLVPLDTIQVVSNSYKNTRVSGVRLFDGTEIFAVTNYDEIKEKLLK